MLGKEVLEEYVALEEPRVVPPLDRDIPVKGMLAIVRIEGGSARVIFLESGTFLKIPRSWLLFFSGLGNWGMEKLPDGTFLRSMAELCYGITTASIIDPNPLIHVLKKGSAEFREWSGFDPLELVSIDKTREI